MSGRGGIYEGPGGQKLHGDGKPVGSPSPPIREEARAARAVAAYTNIHNAAAREGWTKERLDQATDEINLALSDDARPQEAVVTISGTTLTQAQSMTLRVAIENFAIFLSHEGLGNDLHGKSMNRAYLARLNELRALIFKTCV